MRRLALAVLAAVVLAGCTSPEATRMRAGGPGADPGNHARVVKMHEGSNPYWKTPRIPGIAGAPIDTATQADRLSRHD